MKGNRNRAIRTVVVALVVFAIGLLGPMGAAYGKEKAQKRNSSTRAPANDNFAQRQQIKGLPFSGLVDGSRATLEAGEPSCGGMTSSVWFTFTPRSNVDLLAQAASETVGASVAAYVGEDLGSLEQVACSSTPEDASSSNAAGFSFYAERGTAYVFQVGPLEATSDLVELKLTEGTSPQPFVGQPGALPHGWKERVLLKEERGYASEGADLLRFEGRPSADAAMYDMDVWVAGNHVVDRLSLYTAGTIRDTHRYSLLGASSQSVAIEVKVRYDAASQRCLIGLGGECKALLPQVPDADDVTNGKANRAELIVTVQAQRQASTAPIDPVTTTLRIPLVGYAAALLP